MSFLRKWFCHSELAEAERKVGEAFDRNKAQVTQSRKATFHRILGSESTREVLTQMLQRMDNEKAN